MPFAVTPNVHVERAADGSVRQLRHLQQPYTSGARSPLALTAAYLHDVAPIYALPAVALVAINSSYQASNHFTHDPTRLRFVAQSALFDTTTVSFVQTLGGLPIWEAGFSATVQDGPQRITSSFTTFHHNPKVDPPVRDFEPYTVDALSKVLGLREVREVQITGQRRLIYRYQSDQRIDPESKGKPAPLHGPKPTLALPAPPDSLKEGDHYIVVEVLFVTDPGPRSINWRVFIEERTGTVLYLRALVSCILANVYAIDPVSDTGNAALTGCSGDATLDPVQITVDVSVTAASPQPLTGQFVTLSDFRSPASAVPISPPTNFTNLASDSLNFGATNAYYHVDRFFRLMSDLGFDPTTYFSATTLPLPVDPLDTTNGDPQAWTYANAGNVGCAGIGFAHTASACANPALMGTDQRVAFHECSHMILLERIHAANFGFCHSTGDSLAVIYADPRSSAPDRFLTFPFVPPIARRHDRDVTAGWAWGGVSDDHGYGSEQVLSTTQFRVYRSSGGDDSSGDVCLQASNYILYLIIRAVGSLGPGTITPTPSADVWATALMNADTGTASFQGIPGGTVHKMIRWAFEKQGLYQPTGAPVPVVTAGAPPDVDVYIDDGRGGEYPYLQGFWNNTDIWNRSVPDGGTAHQTPVVGIANYAYVRVKNRGTQTANNVSVAGFHATPSSGLTWPDDWMAMTTASLPTSPISSGGSAIVGPFTWTPQFVGHECMLMIASADGDLPNTDPATALPCATGPTPHWHLVPFDNNIAQRNVAPVAGGGGGNGLVASFEPRTFTARNPFDRTARIILEAVLPQFLATRGWSVRFRSAGGNAFSLPGRGERAVVFTLVPGAEFLPADVPLGAAGRIEIHTRVDGLLVGGMSYQVDPGLKSPPTEIPGMGDDCHLHLHDKHQSCGRTRVIIEVDRK